MMKRLIFLLSIYLLVGSVQGATYLQAYDANNVLLMHMNQTADHPTWFYDSSPNNKTVSVFGDSTTNIVTKMLGNASGYFDGTGDYLTVPYTDLLFVDGEAKTWLMWMYTGTPNQARQVIGSRIGDETTKAGQSITPYTDSKLYFTVNAGVTQHQLSTATTIPANAWIQVVINKTVGNLFTYAVNGTIVGTFTTTGALTTHNIFNISNCGGGTFAGQYAGYVDEVAIWTGVSIPVDELYPQTYEVGETLPGTLTADFHADDTTPAVGQTVLFIDDSTGSPTSWNWSFGESPTDFSSNQNPAKVYSAVGTYSINLSVNTTTSQSWMNKSNYITVHDLEGFNQQDLTMSPQFTLTVNIVDSATLLPIPIVTVIDNLGYNTTTTTGTFTHDYEYQTVVLYLSSSGYDGRAVSYVMDSNRTETVTMTASETGNQNANVVWQPRSVAIQILDANYNPIIGDQVDITANSSSLPGGLSGAVDYFKTTYGVTEATAASMFNASVTYSGTTDDNGFIATQVVDVIQYRVATHDTNGIEVIRLFWPSGPYYQIVTENATTDGIAKQADDQADINQYSSFNATYWQPNSTYSCMGVYVYDSTGLTTNVSAWWKIIDNGTAWWTNSTFIGGYGPINSTKCVPHVAYQQWKWGGITG